MYADFVEQDQDFARLFASWDEFRSKIQTWHGLGEADYLEFVGSV